MQTFTTVIMMLTAASTVLAVPVANPEADAGLEKRAATVLICTDQSFGNCVSIGVNGCTNFPGQFNDAVSSLDTYGSGCTFFTDGSCGGNQFFAQGSYATIPPSYNDQLSSVNC